MDEGRLYLGLLTLDLATRACTSLKEKRRVLKDRKSVV